MTYEYTRPSSAFAGEINIDQLKKDTNCSHIIMKNNTIHIYFLNALSAQEEADMDAVIATHVPYIEYEPAQLYVDPTTKSILFNKDNRDVSSDTSMLKTTLRALNTKEIIISNNASDVYSYLSISDAIAANPYPNLIFNIFPGVYIENNPIVLQEGTAIVSQGSVGNTILQAQNNDQDFFTMEKWCSISNVTIVGPSGVGKRTIYWDQTGTSINDQCRVHNVIIKSCYIGIEVENLYNTLTIDMLQIISTLSTHKGLYVHDGGSVVFNYMSIFGEDGIAQCDYGIHCDGVGSNIRGIGLHTKYVDTCVLVDNNSSITIDLYKSSYDNKVLEVGPTGASNMLLTSIYIYDSTSYNLYISSAHAHVKIMGGQLDVTKIYNLHNVDICLGSAVFNPDGHFHSYIGDMYIGSVENPSSLIVGEGRNNHTLMVVLSNDDLDIGTWVDNTNVALYDDNVVFDLFQSTSVDSCFYVGYVKNIAVIKMSVSRSVLTGVYVIEYWDGVAWTSIQNKQINKYDQTAYITCIFDTVSTYIINFDAVSFGDKTLNGYVDKKWIRFRIITAFDAVPQSKFINVIPDATKIRKNGEILFVGEAEKYIPLSINFNDMCVLDDSVVKTDVYFTKKIGIKNKFNTFIAGGTVIMSYSTYMYNNINTAKDIKFRMSYVVDDASAGDIVLFLYRHHVYADTVVHDSAANAPSDMVHKTLTINISANDNGKAKFLDFSISVASNENVNESVLFFSIERVGTSGLDTYSGSMTVMQIEGKYCIYWFGEVN